MGSVFGQVNAIVSYEAGLIVNSGTISALASGVSMNLFGTGGTLANDGLIRADLYYGVNVVGGSATLTNHGTIEALGSANGGQPTGVYLGGSGSVLVNSGLIFGTYNGITLGADFSEQTITNSGTIQGNHAAIQSAETATASFQTITNSGPLTGGQFAYIGNGFATTLTNTGTINGTILLGDGFDSFRGIGATIRRNRLCLRPRVLPAAHLRRKPLPPRHRRFHGPWQRQGQQHHRQVRRQRACRAEWQ
jgi:hypothetical protein